MKKLEVAKRQHIGVCFAIAEGYRLKPEVSDAEMGDLARILLSNYGFNYKLVNKVNTMIIDKIIEVAKAHSTGDMYVAQCEKVLLDFIF